MSQGSAGRRTTRRYRAWRALMLAKWPLCVHCLAEGRTVAAVELDHVVPLAAGGALMNPLNVQGLCDAHHQKKTAADFGHAALADRDEWLELLEAMR